MNHHYDDRGLHDLLDRATDLVASPDLAERALVQARRRTAVRRHTTIIGVAMVVGVTGVGVMLGVRDGSESARPPTASIPTQPAPTSPARTGADRAIDPALIQQKWDPREVLDLPAAGAVIPGLPANVTPPDTAPLLTDAPIDSAVLAVDRGSAIKLLSPTGEWRRIPVEEGPWKQVALSPSGAQLAIRYDERVDLWQLPSAETTSIGDPETFKDMDYPDVLWIDEATLLFDDYVGGWLVDTASGNETRVPYPESIGQYWSATDAAGTVVESRDFDVAPALVDWATGEARDVPMARLGHLSHLAVSRTTVAGTSYDSTGPAGYVVVAADRQDMSPIAVLPLRDFEGNYSNWGLGVQAVRDDGTLVLWVAVIPKGSGSRGWALVQWNPRSGDLKLLTRSDSSDYKSFSFAAKILR